MTGGRFAMLECVDDPKLIALYESMGLKCYQQKKMVIILLL